MTCREFAAFLMEYLENELSEEQRREFEHHLAECDMCVVYLQNYRAVVRLGKAAFTEADGPLPKDVPEELVQAILAARVKPYGS